MTTAARFPRLILALTVFVGVCVLLSLPLAAAPETKRRKPEISTTVVISQVYDSATAALRKSNGCQDTDANVADFDKLEPAPRNSVSPLNYCQATATPTASPTAGPTSTFTPTATATYTPTPFPSGIVINEFLPDPASDWNGDTLINSDDEWIELFNTNAFAVDVGGWKLDDMDAGGSTPYTIPSGTTIAAHGFLIFYASASNVALNNTGDSVRLLYPDDAVADSTSYSSSADDETYARNPNGTGAFTTACAPTPNALNCSAPPTDTPTSAATFTPTSTGTFTVTFTPTSTGTFTATFTPTFTPTSVPAGAVVINEVAWSGTDASSSDEWLELYNTTANAIDVTNWTLSDGGDVNIVLSGSIPALGYYLLERTDDTAVNDLIADKIYTGSLNNGGEALSLRDAWANVIDTANGNGGAWPAGTASPPCSMERIDASQVDADTNWATNDNVNRNGLDAANNPLCGTPKNQNSASLPVTPTSTATFTPTSTGTFAVTFTPTSTATFTATFTPTFTRTPAPGGLYVNEFMPDPAQDWNGDTLADDNDEWIEIYNANAFSVDLSGWQLDDVANGGSAAYTIPGGTSIGANGFLLFYRADTHLALNNSNDDVRLLQPDDTVADTISYKTSSPNAAWARVPDGANYFSIYCPPTPNASNCSVAPTPTLTPTPLAKKIFINEFLPAPYQDWNHDNVLDAGDEWIELYNASNQAVDLSGWQIDDAKNGSAPYQIPDGTQLDARSFMLLFARDTNVGLNNDGDTVRLLYPDDTVADKYKYEPIETNKSYARVPDGAAKWSTLCLPTPGAPNCTNNATAAPTRVFNLTTIAEARALPLGSVVSVLGSVIAHPCEFDLYGHELVLSDGSAGINVYMGYPARMSCLMPRHEQIVVTGVISDHYGLTTLYPQSNFDLTRHYQEPRALAPRAVHTGNFGENAESMLVTIQGKVSNGKNGDTLWVNDGTGAVRVYADEFSHTTLEGIPRGSIVRITGVGYQYNGGVLPKEGYYLRVRAPDDVLVLERAEKLPEAPGGRGGVDLGAVAIDQARAAATQNYVTVGGVVTMPPGVVDDRAFWLQDASGGIHVFVSTTAGALPTIQLHDNVSVRGRIVNSFGARELRVELPDAIGVHGAGAPAEPVTLQTSQVDLSREGALVQIHGWVARFDGREIYIDDGSGPVLVYIDADTGIRWPRLHIGDPAIIRGIVARFRGAPEILPRLQRDVQFGAALLPIAGAPAPTFLYQLRALGRVGEDLMWTQKVDARAAGAAARIDAPSPKRAAKTHSPVALQPQMLRARDAVTTLTLLLLALSGVCGVIAAHKYRGARRLH